MQNLSAGIDTSKNETFPYQVPTNSTHNATGGGGAIFPYLKNLRNISLDEKSSFKGIEKIYGKPSRLSTEQSSTSRNVGHPKRESVSHPTRHKGPKDLHKINSITATQANNFNGFDVVLVDLPSSYPRAVRRMNPLTPSVRYVPMNRAPTILDFLMGFDSMGQNLLAEPVEMGNEVLIQQSMDNQSWNRRFDRFMNSIANHLSGVNGDRVHKDANSTQMYGNLSESKSCTCTCEKRNKL